MLFAFIAFYVKRKNLKLCLTHEIIILRRYKKYKSFTKISTSLIIVTVPKNILDSVPEGFEKLNKKV